MHIYAENKIFHLLENELRFFFTKFTFYSKNKFNMEKKIISQ